MRCEYCLLFEGYSEVPHHIEHIRSKQHSGSDELDNLALACHRCNLKKGPNLTGVDPETTNVAPLFHPRKDIWTGHFTLKGPKFVGLTPVGRATIQLLAMNDARRITLRSELIALGLLDERLHFDVK